MRTLLLLMALVACASPAAAQKPLPVPLPDNCPDLLKLLSVTTSPADRQTVAKALTRIEDHPQCVAQKLSALATPLTEVNAFHAFEKALETARTDKQGGTGVGTGGSTSLVSKGTSAKVLSIAAEYGALSESVAKQVVTVQGSLDGIPAALVRHELVPYCPTSGAPGCVSAGLIQALQRVSYSVSFDTSASGQAVTATSTSSGAGAAQPVTFDASGHSITNASLRVVLWNARDRTSQNFQSQWKQNVSSSQALKTDAVALGKATSDFVNAVVKSPGYGDWQSTTRDKLAAISAAGTEQAVWDAALTSLFAELQASTPDALDKASAQIAALSVYTMTEQAVVDTLQKPIATIGYDYNRPADQPPTSTVRLIFDKGLPGGWSVAANGAVELYDQMPPSTIPGAGKIRDVQAGIQFQKDLGTLSVLGAVAVAGAYYFQYQNSPAILNVTPSAPIDGIAFVGLPAAATQVFATKGNIHIAQVRLVLGPDGSSARFPFSITYSNRTDLIDKPAWRAQIGVSYDFDSLFGK